jgi:RNA polymerase sigma-70 factor, ECF subfamily
MSAEIATAIQLAKGGDRQAFYLLYKQNIGRVYALSWRLLGDRQRAEDACQEVFVKVWQSLAHYQGDSSFATWLHSIATRTVIDLWRKDKRLMFVDANQWTEAADSQAQETTTPYTADADAMDLEQAIQRLPAQAKAVFILFALEGYQHTEIADMLGIAEGSSKAQYHRARQLLRSFLSED